MNVRVDVANVIEFAEVLERPLPKDEIALPAPDPAHDPSGNWKHPPARMMPFVNVDVALPEILRAVACTPAPNVDVADPRIVVVAVPPIASLLPEKRFANRFDDVAFASVVFPITFNVFVAVS